MGRDPCLACLEAPSPNHPLLKVQLSTRTYIQPNIPNPKSFSPKPELVPAPNPSIATISATKKTDNESPPRQIHLGPKMSLRRIFPQRRSWKQSRMEPFLPKKVIVKAFPVATTDDIEDFNKPILKKEHDSIIALLWHYFGSLKWRWRPRP